MAVLVVVMVPTEEGYEVLVKRATSALDVGCCRSSCCKVEVSGLLLFSVKPVGVGGSIEDVLWCAFSECCWCNCSGD